MSGVTICESKEQFEEIIASDSLTVVDFFAVWCPPCQFIAPVLDTMSQELNGKVIFLKIDVDQLEDLAMEQGISAMPTFAFWRSGEKLEEFAGANEERIRNTITKYI